MLRLAEPHYQNAVMRMLFCVCVCVCVCVRARARARVRTYILELCKEP